MALIGSLEGRREAGAFVFFMVFLPLLLSVSYIISFMTFQDILAGFICGVSMVVVYHFSRKHDYSSQVSITFTVGAVLFVLFLVSTETLDGGQNPFEYYSPYIGGLSAWALPTIMWQETNWLLDSDKVDLEMSSHVRESIGFAVALVYTISYVLYDLYGRQADSAPTLFMGFVVMWLIIRIWTARESL